MTLIDTSAWVEQLRAKGDAAVRGSASDLFRFVWNRGRGSSLEVAGDTGVADEWAALAP